MRYVLEAARPILIDLLSTIVFFILLWATHDFVLATALGIAAGVAEVTIRLIRRKPVGVITWMSLGLVVLMGSASIFTHNPLFVMLKADDRLQSHQCDHAEAGLDLRLHTSDRAAVPYAR